MSRKKTEHITLRATQEEKLLIREKAASSGCSLQGYILSCALGDSVVPLRDAKGMKLGENWKDFPVDTW